MLTDTLTQKLGEVSRIQDVFNFIGESGDARLEPM
jgi:hypothetical protein